MAQKVGTLRGGGRGKREADHLVAVEAAIVAVETTVAVPVAAGATAAVSAEAEEAAAAGDLAEVRSLAI